MCDVGSQNTWVADYSARLLPCCCGMHRNLSASLVTSRIYLSNRDVMLIYGYLGFDCSETEEFLDRIHTSGNKNFNKACGKQYEGYKSGSSSIHPSLLLIVLGAIFVLV